MLSRSLDVTRPKYKYLFAFAAIVLAFLPLVKVSFRNPPPEPSSLVESFLVSAVDTPQNQQPTLPQTLEIPKISLKSKVEIVGLDPNGLMSVPAEGKSVSWYKFGPKPGQIGNSVIAGHYDTSKGPAIFYRLRELDLGDTILVTDSDGLTRRFEVYEIEVVKTDEFDVQKVYGKNNIPSLNLITCHGKFDLAIDTYNQRLIVYSKLQSQ